MLYISTGACVCSCVWAHLPHDRARADAVAPRVVFGRVGVRAGVEGGRTGANAKRVALGRGASQPPARIANPRASVSSRAAHNRRSARSQSPRTITLAPAPPRAAPHRHGHRWHRRERHRVVQHWDVDVGDQDVCSNRGGARERRLPRRRARADAGHAVGDAVAHAVAQLHAVALGDADDVAVGHRLRVANAVADTIGVG